MGLDYGSVTVGVAISDELLLTAQGIETIRRKKENQLRQTFQRQANELRFRRRQRVFLRDMKTK